MTLLLGLAWAALVLLAAARAAPRPARVVALTAPARRHRPLPSPALGVGRLGFRLVRRPVRDPAEARRVGRVVLAAVVAVAVAPPLAAAIPLVAWAVPRLRARRAQRAARAAVVVALPETVDLLAVAVDAGLTVPLALRVVARRGRGPIAAALAGALDEVALGRRLADALDALPSRCGEAVRPLVAALVASERYGAPLGDALERLAAEVRRRRRQAAEEAARRIPVKLLFPLVCCTLPAFALLTVAPLVASALRSLRLP